MSYFDLIIIAIICLSGAISFFRGFVQECLSLALWIIAFAAAMFLDEYLDPYISAYISNIEVKRIVSLVVIFVGVIFAGGFIIKFLRSLIHWSGLGGFDRFLGILFGFIRGMILILIMYLVLPLDMKQSDFISQSTSSPFLDKFAPKVEKFFKNMISNTNSVMLDPNITATKKT
jgi:membrane protein required for colicin V production